jgi:hypothetical protein
MQMARAALQEHGATYIDRFGSPHARPEVRIENDAKTHFRQLVRELDLDLAAPPESGARPPSFVLSHHPSN